VPDGSSLILIPIHIIYGSPTVGGKAVTVGTCILLKETALVEPGFYCLAIRDP
jgi:hypothetical protein